MNKRKQNYKKTQVYTNVSDTEYIREKLGREMEPKDFLEALLEKLSKL